MSDIGSAQWWQAQYEAAQAEVNRQEKAIEALADALKRSRRWVTTGANADATRKQIDDALKMAGRIG